MPTKPQEKQPAGREKQDRSQLHSVIGKIVLHTLGQPGDLHRIQIRPLWDDHYRVNILLGSDGASARIAHSFFLVADGEGNIITSNPVIKKQY